MIARKTKEFAKICSRNEDLNDKERADNSLYQTLQLQIKTSLNHQEGVDTQSLLTSNQQATFTQNNATKLFEALPLSQETHLSFANCGTWHKPTLSFNSD